MEVSDDINHRTFQKFEPAPRRGEPEVSLVGCGCGGLVWQGMV